MEIFELKELKSTVNWLVLGVPLAMAPAMRAKAIGLGQGHTTWRDKFAGVRVGVGSVQRDLLNGRSQMATQHIKKNIMVLLVGRYGSSREFWRDR
ncbi:hypothetical protein CRG98_001018 [Punica granatum]|uniref:Uncharacterized protein n=1 Tax=Punica granatum TaxID=22663 RepID=A0A2I0LD87_PUNGR|nr:hypothetical protein CRG98_001018 [Punica granatum]